VGLFSVPDAPASNPIVPNSFLPAEDGSKLVVFGGRAFVGPVWKLTNELFVLDLNTLTWSKGQSFSTTRTFSACTIVGSTFISWGGMPFLCPLLMQSRFFFLATLISNANSQSCVTM